MSDSKIKLTSVVVKGELEDKISPGLKQIDKSTKEVTKTVEDLTKTLHELMDEKIKPDVDSSGIDDLDKKFKNATKNPKEISVKFNDSQARAELDKFKSQYEAALSKVDKTLSKYTGQKDQNGLLSKASGLRTGLSSSYNKLFSELAKGSQADAKQVIQYISEIDSRSQKLRDTLTTVNNTFSPNAAESSLKKQIDLIQKYRTEVEQIASVQQKSGLDNILGKYTTGMTTAEKSAADKEFQDLKKIIDVRKQLVEVQKNANYGSYSATEAGYRNTLSKYEGQTSEALTRARNSLSEFKEIREDFQNSLKDTNISDLSDEEVKRLSENLQKMTEEEEKYKTAIKQVKAEETATLAPGVALRASNEMQSYINNNSKAWKKYKAQLEEVRDAYKQVTTEGEKLEVDAKARNLKAKISAEGLTGASFLEDTKRAVGQIAQFTGIYGILQNAMQGLPQQVISNVKEINDAQIELTKVASDASESQLSQYWDQAAESAKKYGAAVSDVISSTADWSRLGYSLDDAKELSDMTTLLQRVGDNMTQETSSSGLISTLKGFQLEADQAQRIVDVANEVANTQPIDTSGVFEVLERSASSLNAASNTYEQSVALASAANSVVQNPEKVGTALKTISMRIRSAESDLQEAGLDTEGMVTSTAKLRKEVLALSGVDILKDKDTFKSTYQILDELADKWSDLTDIQQADYTCLYVQKCA